MKRNKTIWMALALVLAIALALCLYLGFRDKAAEGHKTISVSVVFEDGTQKLHQIETERETLREALEDEGLIGGEESTYGLFITTVDGVQADEAQQQWWCLEKNGEMLNSGVDSTMLSDGDEYSLSLRTGW